MNLFVELMSRNAPSPPHHGVGPDGGACAHCSRLVLKQVRCTTGALTLIQSQQNLLRALQDVAFEGSRLVAEAKGLEPQERKVLLKLFALLHVETGLEEPWSEERQVSL